MTALHHAKGIRCIHIHGWNVNKWCPRCRHRWDASSLEGLTAADYERESDVALAHAALVAMEAGEIPISPLLADFDLATVFVELASHPTATESPIPSPGPAQAAPGLCTPHTLKGHQSCTTTTPTSGERRSQEAQRDTRPETSPLATRAARVCEPPGPMRARADR